MHSESASVTLFGRMRSNEALFKNLWSSSNIAKRQDLHLARKAWHASMGLLIVFLFWNVFSREGSVQVLSLIFSAFLALEVLRLNSPRVNAFVVKVARPIIRTQEVDELSGIPYYIGAALLCVGLFPREIAALSILLLALGDPFASIIGIMYGDRGPKLPKGKSLIGTLGGIAMCFLVSLVFLGLHWEGSFREIIILSLIGGLSGGMAELVPVDVDDNLIIPVLSGFVLWISSSLI